MNFPIQPEPSSPSRAQSPIGQAETSTLAEVNPSPLQPEASELPETVSAPSHLEASAFPEHLLHQWLQKSPLKLNKTLFQFRKLGMR
jgi:hypothetical protein